jgi:hypothetical protein
MGSIPNLREKCLLVKEKWVIVLTGIAGVCYRRASDASHLQLWFDPLPSGTAPLEGCGVVAVVLELD